MKTSRPCWKRFFASVEQTITTTKKTSVLSLTSYFWPRPLEDAIFSWRKKSAAYLESLADPVYKPENAKKSHDYDGAQTWPNRFVRSQLTAHSSCGTFKYKEISFKKPLTILSFALSLFHPVFYFLIKHVAHYDITTSISIKAERTPTTHKYKQKNRKNKSFFPSWACAYVSASWERHAVSISLSIRESPAFFCHCFEEYGTKSKAIIAHAYLLVL